MSGRRSGSRGQASGSGPPPSHPPQPPPPQQQHTSSRSGGKRKLLMEANIGTGSSSSSQDEAGYGNPAQKPRLEDDVVGKFLQLLHRTFEMTTENAAGSDLIPLHTDLLSEIATALVSEPPPRLGAEQACHLLTMLELTLCEVLGTGTSSSGSKPPSHHQEVRARLSSAAVAFALNLATFTQRHLSGSKKGVDCLEQAVTVLEMLHKGPPCPPDLKVAILTSLGNGQCPSFSLNISKELQARLHVLVFEGGGHLKGEMAASSASAPDCKLPAIDLMLRNPLVDMEEIVSPYEDAPPPSRALRIANPPPASGQTSPFLLHRCGARLADLCIALLQSSESAASFARGNKKPPQKGRAVKGDKNGDGDMEAYDEERIKLALKDEAALAGPAALLGFIERTVHLMGRIEADVHAAMDSSHPFPLQGDPGTLNKCITLVELLMLAYDQTRSAALPVVARVLRGNEGGSHPRSKPTLIPVIYGELARCLGPSGVAMDAVLSTAQWNDPDPRCATAKALKAYVAARSAATFLPASSHLLHILGRPSGAPPPHACPISLSTATLVISYMQDELQAAGKASSPDGGEKDALSPIYSHARRSSSGSYSFERQQPMIGRTPVKRIQWVLHRLSEGEGRGPTWMPLLAVLIQVVRQYSNLKEEPEKETSRNIISTLSATLAGLEGLVASASTAREEDDVGLQMEALYEVAEELATIPGPSSKSLVPSFAKLCESMTKIYKSELVPESGEVLISRILEGNSQAWPLRLPLPVMVLLVHFFSSCSDDVRQSLAPRVAHLYLEAFKRPEVTPASRFDRAHTKFLSALIASVTPGDARLGLAAELVMAWVGVAKAWRGDGPVGFLYDMTTLAESVVSMALDPEPGSSLAVFTWLCVTFSSEVGLQALQRTTEEGGSNVISCARVPLVNVAELISKGVDVEQLKACYNVLVQQLLANKVVSDSMAAQLYMALWRLISQLDRAASASDMVTDDVKEVWLRAVKGLAPDGSRASAESLLVFNRLLARGNGVPGSVLSDLASVAQAICKEERASGQEGAEKEEGSLSAAVRYAIVDALLGVMGRSIQGMIDNPEALSDIATVADPLLEVIEVILELYDGSISTLAGRHIRRALIDITAAEEDDEECSSSVHNADSMDDKEEVPRGVEALASVEMELQRLAVLALSVPSDAPFLRSARHQLRLTHPSLEDLLGINNEGEKPAPAVKMDPDAMMVALSEEEGCPAAAEVTCLDTALTKHILCMGSSEHLGDIEQGRRHLVCTGRLLTGLIQPLEWLTRGLSQVIRERKSSGGSSIALGGITCGGNAEMDRVMARDRLLEILATMGRDPVMMFLNQTCLTLLHRLWAEAGVRPRTSVSALVDAKRAEIGLRVLTNSPCRIPLERCSQWEEHVTDLSQGLRLWALQELASSLNSKHGQATLLSLLAPEPFFPLWAWRRTPTGLGAVLELFLRGPSNGWDEASTVAGHIIAWAFHVAKGSDSSSGTGAASEEALAAVCKETCQHLERLGTDGIVALLKSCLQGEEGCIRGLAWDLTSVLYVLCEWGGFKEGNTSSLFERTLLAALQALVPWLLETTSFHPLRLLELGCMLGANQGKVQELACILLDSAESYSRSEGGPSKITALALSLELLDGLLHSQEPGPAKTKTDVGGTSSVSDRLDTVKESESKVCSSTRLKGEYADQHWYHCFSCGLKWEEGCCSACARVCHEGHDVSYSSFSNFLCDCGGETESAMEAGGGWKCQCCGLKGSMAPSQESSIVKVGPSTSGVQSPSCWHSLASGDLQLRDCIQRVRQGGPHFVYSSIPDFLSRMCHLSEKLISLLWMDGGDASLMPGGSPPTAGRAITETGEKVPPTPLKPSDVRAAGLSGVPQEQKAMLYPLRLLEQGSLDVKINQETSRGRQFKTLIMSGHVRRNVLSADAQGRVAVVEQEHVLVANVAHLFVPPSWTSSAESRAKLGGGASACFTSVVVDRSRLCILSKTTAAFQVLGVLFNPVNSNYLAVWGLRDCMVLTLDASGAVVAKKTIDASYDTVTFNSGIIKQVRWVPGSDVHLCIVSDSSIKVFNFTRGSGNATHCFRTSAVDPTVIDATIVPRLVDERKSSKLGSRGRSKLSEAKDNTLAGTLVVMTKSCKMYALPLEDNASSSSTVETQIDAGQPLPLPADLASTEEGVMTIYYSEACQYLLISFEDEHVVAAKLDRRVTRIERAFPLFSTASLLPSGRGYLDEAPLPAPSGPYNRFVDCPGFCGSANGLLMVVARVSRQRSERVVALRLVTDGDEDRLHVHQPRWRMNPDVVGGSPHASSVVAPGTIEGMCGGPVALGASTGVRCLPPSVLVLHENGSLQIFVDRDLYGNKHPTSTPRAIDGARLISSGPSLPACITTILAGRTGRTGAASTMSSLTKPNQCTVVAIPDMDSEEKDGWSPLRVPHVTALESLTNVTQHKDLQISSDPFSTFSPEHLRQKLSQDNEEFVVSPRTEGFSLSIRLKSADMELAALRVLVGNTSLEFIPRELRVMGRTYPTTKGVRRWYDLLLSDEEIRLARETGLMAFSISNSFEQTNPAIIDALEVYARRQTTAVAHASPATAWRAETEGGISYSSASGSGASGGSRQATQLERSVVGCTQVLQEACRAAGPGGLPEAVRSQILAPLSLALGRTICVKGMSCIPPRHLKPSQRRARAVRAAAKKVLACLLPNRDEYLRFKDQIHLEHTKALLTSPQSPTHDDIQACVRVGLRIMSRRPENLKEGLARLFLGKLLGFLEPLTEKEVGGGAAITSQLVGDVVELGLWEISYAREVLGERPSILEADKAAISKEVAPFLALLNNSSEHVSSGVAVRLVAMIKEMLRGMESPPKAQSVVSKSPKGSSGSQVHSKSKAKGKATSKVTISLPPAPPAMPPSLQPPPPLPSQTELVLGPEVEYRCDGCDHYPLRFVRWHCQECMDFDLCDTCYNSGGITWDISLGHAASHRMTRLEIAEIEEPPSESAGIDLLDEPPASMCQHAEDERAEVQEEEEEEEREGQEQRVEPEAEVELEPTPMEVATEESPTIPGGELETEPAPTSSGCRLVDVVWAVVYERVLESLKSALESNEAPGVWRQVVVNHLNIAMGMASASHLERFCSLKDLLDLLANSFNRALQHLHHELLSRDGAQEEKSVIAPSSWTDAVILLAKSLESLWYSLVRRSKVTSADKIKASSSQPSCKVHKAPASLRLCSTGKHQGEYYYICSHPKPSRCTYFRWADRVKEKKEAHLSRTQPVHRIENSWLLESAHALASLGGVRGGKGPAAEKLLCDIMRLSVDQQGSPSSLSSLESERPSTTPDLEAMRSMWPRPSPPSTMEAYMKQWSQVVEPLEDPMSTIRSSTLFLLTAILKVLRRVTVAADTPQGDKESHAAEQISWSHEWPRLLCEIIARKEGAVRQIAKKMLRSLYTSRAEYQRIRDLHLFSRSLLSILNSPEVRSEGGILSVSKLPYEVQVQMHGAIAGMVKVAEERRANWRVFCSHLEFPLIPIEEAEATTSLPPICAFFDLSCRLEDCELQSSCFHLLEMGTAPPEEGDNDDIGTRGVCAQDAEDEEEEEEDEDEEEEEEEGEAGEADGDAKNDEDGEDDEAESCHGSDFDYAVEDKLMVSTKNGQDVVPDAPTRTDAIDKTRSQSGQQDVVFMDTSSDSKEVKPSEPMAILLKEARLNAQHFLRLSVEVLAGSNCAETRLTCGKILRRMWDHLAVTQRATIVAAVPSRLGLVLRQGRHASEFFALITLISRTPEFPDLAQSSGALAELSERLLASLVAQLEVLESHPHGDMYAVIESLMETPTYLLDPRPCTVCLRATPSSAAKAVVFGTSAAGGGGSVFPSGGGGEPSFRSVTLDSLKGSQRSTESTHIFLLKTRQRIRRLSLKVHEPHGRFVKRIILSFHPRTVSSVNEVQLPENRHKWERVGVITLNPGQVSADLDVAVPFVAGCLLFEYEEFHSNGSGGKSANVLHCPQCGRQVTDAHGVCRHCGEVAFQCRHCRHINYERFDAFLCVECGYCAYGQFSYRLQAAPAPAATPIHTQEDKEALLVLYTSHAKEVQEEQEKLNQAVADLRGRMRELEPFMGAASGLVSRLSPSCPDFSDAVSVLVPSLSEGLPHDIARILNGHSRGYGDEVIDTGAVIGAGRVAKFVFVTEGGGEIETESRDEDDEDMEEEVEDDMEEGTRPRASIQIQQPSSSSQGQGGGSNATASTDLETSTFERILAGISGGPSSSSALRVSSQRANATSSSSTPPIPPPLISVAAGGGEGLSRVGLELAPALLARQSAAPVGGASGARGALGSAADKPAVQSSSIATAALEAGAMLTALTVKPRPVWSAPAALAARQSVLDYYNKNVKPIQDKIMSRSREMAAISDEILAYHRKLMTKRGAPGAVAGDDDFMDEDEDDVVATSCYQCCQHAVAGLAQVLLSVLAIKSGAMALLKAGIVRRLTGPWLQSRHHIVRHGTRAALSTLCLTCPDEAIPDVHKAVLGQFHAVLQSSQSAANFVAHRDALRDLVELVVDLCTADAPPSMPLEERKKQRVARLRAWSMHLSLPLVFLRYAAKMGETNKVVTTDVILPCLQVLAAVTTGLYPHLVDQDEESGQAVDVASRSLMERVVEDFLCGDPMDLSEGVNQGWKTVDQERSLRLIHRLLDQWRRREKTEVASSASSRSPSPTPTSTDVKRCDEFKGHRSWLTSLLTNPYSFDVRRQAALMILHGIPSEGEDGEEGEEEGGEKGEEIEQMCGEEHGDDEENGEGEEDGAGGENGREGMTSPPWGIDATRAIDVLMVAMHNLVHLSGPNVRDVVSLQLLATLQHLFHHSSNAAFCVARGGVPFLCEAIEREVALLRRAEGRALRGYPRDDSCDKGALLQQLTALLHTLLSHPSVYIAVLRKNMTGVVRVLVALRHSLVLRTSAVETALSGLQVVVSRPPRDDPASRLQHQRSFLKAAIEVLSTVGSSSNLRLIPTAVRLFLLQQMQLTICPPQSQPKFRVHLRRAPSQEEFFRGSLSKNPIWSTDIPHESVEDDQPETGDGGEPEPTMRDLRSMIAKDLGIADATELLELLVTGKIINVDLPVRLVFEKVWRPFVAERHPDEYGTEDMSHDLLPSMVVTYRLAGVDGEATEEVVEALAESSATEGETSDPNDQYRATTVLGEGEGLSLLLSLACPPMGSVTATDEAWEVSALATRILRLACKIRENRASLLELNAPGTLLTQLLLVLGCASKMSHASAVTLNLLQVVEDLGGGTEGVAAVESWTSATMEVEEEEDDDKIAAFIDGLTDPALVTALLKSPSLTKAVGRLLPSLTHGKRRASKALADCVLADLAWEKVERLGDETSQLEGPERLRLTVLLESLAGLAEGSGRTTQGSNRLGLLRDLLLENGFTGSVLMAIQGGLPETGIRQCAMNSGTRAEYLKQKDQVESQWKQYLGRTGLIQAMRVLRGLSQSHLRTQELMISKGLLPILHDVEEITTSGEAGSLAEILLESLVEENPQAAQAIKELRKQTREHKRRLAQQNRNRALQQMGFKPNTPKLPEPASGSQAAADSGLPLALQSTGASSSASMEPRASQDAPGDASTAAASAQAQRQPPRPSSGKQKKGLDPGPSKWLSELEGLEEESGHSCMVCQEGYSFKPKEALGLYIYGKALTGQDLTLLEGDSLVKDNIPNPSGPDRRGSSSSAGIHDPSRSLIDAVVLGSVARPSSRKCCKLVTTVTAFNMIHFSCHAEAVRADRALKQPKSEWDGAALRNSRVSCNGMLPLRGPKSMDEAYRLAVERHFSRLSTLGVGQQSPVGRFGLVVHDLRILLLRLSWQESLREDCGGGSLSSNMRLVPYQLQLGHYVLERISEGDDNMGTLSEARRLEEALRSFMGKQGVIASALTAAPQEALPEDTRRLLTALEESAIMMVVVSLFFLTQSEWLEARPTFVRALLIRAGVMKGRGEQGSGASSARRRPRVASFSADNSVSGSDSISLSSSSSNVRKRKRSMSEGSEEESVAPTPCRSEEEILLETCRPMMLLLRFVDSVHHSFPKAGATLAGAVWRTEMSLNVYGDDRAVLAKAEGLTKLYEKLVSEEGSRLSTLVADMDGVTAGDDLVGHVGRLVGIGQSLA